jgi:hypothetical protein
MDARLAALFVAAIMASSTIMQNSHASTISCHPNSLAMKDTDGNVITTLRAGQHAIFSALIFDCRDDVTEVQSFIVMVEARDAAGVTHYLRWQHGTIDDPNNHVDLQVEMPVSWLPQQAGDYQIRMFLIDGFDNPRAFSAIQTLDVTVKPALSADDMNEMILYYVQSKYADDPYVELDKVSILESKFIDIRDHKIFDVKVQTRSDGYYMQFYINPATGKIYNGYPDFWQITGIANMDYELWRILQTAADEDQVPIVLHLQRLPEDDEPKRISVLQKVLKQLQEFGDDVQVTDTFGVPNSISISVVTKAALVDDLTSLPNVTQASLNTVIPCC